MLSQALAAEHHLHVGQSVHAALAAATRLRVAALSTNLGWPPGAIIINSAGLRARVGQQPTRARMRFRPRPAPRRATRASPRAARVGAAESGLAVETASRTRAAPLRSREPGPLAADADQAARADRRDARRCRGDGRDDLAAPRSRGVHQVPGLTAEAVLWRWLLCESAVLLGVGLLDRRGLRPRTRSCWGVTSWQRHRFPDRLRHRRSRRAVQLRAGQRHRRCGGRRARISRSACPPRSGQPGVSDPCAHSARAT